MTKSKVGANMKWTDFTIYRDYKSMGGVRLREEIRLENLESFTLDEFKRFLTKEFYGK